MKVIETLIESCEDVAEGVPGLEVVDEGSRHLRITDPKLALWFQPLSREVVNDVPNPPKLFRPETDFVDKDTPVPVPWMSPTQEYIQEYDLSKEEYFVSFINHGEFRTGTSTYQRKNRADRYAKERSEDLLDEGVPPDRQLIITLDGYVRESITHRLAALYLANEGWLVSTDFLYLPPGNEGAPDIVAWKSPFTGKLRREGLIKGGATLHELAYLGLSNSRSQRTQGSEIDDSETLVAEVKGSDRSLGEAHKQLKKYLDWDFFDYGYGTVPGYRGREKPNAGTITLDKTGFHMVADPGEKDDNLKHSQTDEKNWFVEHMDSVARQTLLCNLSYNTVVELAPASINSPNHLARALWNMETDKILKEVSREGRFY